MSRFKQRIRELLDKSRIREGRFERDMAFFIRRQLIFRLLGNAMQPKVCMNCGKIEARRTYILGFPRVQGGRVMFKPRCITNDL